MSLLSEPGDLARTPLAAVLLEALNLRASGVLEMQDRGSRSRLWFLEGRPVGAQVVAGFRPLGIALLQAGRIDVDALSRSLSIMAETGRAQGEILVELGCVSREEVDRALAEQQSTYLSRIVALESGAFRFDAAAEVPPGPGAAAPAAPARWSTRSARPEADPLVVEALRRVASEGVRLAAGYREAEAGFGWTGPERALVERLEPAASLETCLGAPGVPRERARAMLAALLLLGLAAPGLGDRRAGAVARARRGAREAAAPAPPGDAQHGHRPLRGRTPRDRTRRDGRAPPPAAASAAAPAGAPAGSAGRGRAPGPPREPDRGGAPEGAARRGPSAQERPVRAPRPAGHRRARGRAARVPAAGGR